MGILLSDRAEKAVLSGSINGASLNHLIEKEILRLVMKKCGYNQTKAAKSFHITRNTLIKRLNKHFNEEELL